MKIVRVSSILIYLAFFFATFVNKELNLVVWHSFYQFAFFLAIGYGLFLLGIWEYHHYHKKTNL